jgi:hypothetical protein
VLIAEQQLWLVQDIDNTLKVEHKLASSDDLHNNNNNRLFFSNFEIQFWFSNSPADGGGTLMFWKPQAFG